MLLAELQKVNSSPCRMWECFIPKNEFTCFHCACLRMFESGCLCLCLCLCVVRNSQSDRLA